MEIEGSGLHLVKFENVGTHKRHSLPVEIEKGRGLRSEKCENVWTHNHSLSVEIEEGSKLRSVKCEDVWTHKRYSLPVEIERGSRLRSVNVRMLGLINDTHRL